MNFQLNNDNNWEETTISGYPAKRMIWSSSNAVSMAGFGRVPYYNENAEYMSLANTANYKLAGYQCVGLVVAVAGIGSTSTWERGDQITTSNLPSRGDIIATFKYDSVKQKYVYDYRHTAIVWDADTTKITVIDQNWEENNLNVGGKIIKHEILFSGSGYVGDASNYYHVEK